MVHDKEHKQKRKTYVIPPLNDTPQYRRDKHAARRHSTANEGCRLETLAPSTSPGSSKIVTNGSLQQQHATKSSKLMGAATAAMIQPAPGPKVSF